MISKGTTYGTKEKELKDGTKKETIDYDNLLTKISEKKGWISENNLFYLDNSDKKQSISWIINNYKGLKDLKLTFENP